MLFEWLSRNTFHPLWDLKDGSVRLKTLRILERSQWQTLDELKERQWERLKWILTYAYTHCPYYREQFDNHEIHPSHLRSPNHFLTVPILSKQQIQQSGNALISRLYQPNVLRSAKTGGSTGTALKVHFDKRCEDTRNAAAIRSNRWANWNIGEKVAALWGNPGHPDTLKKKIRHALYDRTIVLDTMDLNANSMMAFVNRWREYNPGIMFGHSHSLYLFATFIQEHGIRDIRPKGIISTSMMLLLQERERIEHVFRCKLTNRYGCEEVGLIASECERHDGMHLNIDHLYIEFLKEDGNPASAGEHGQIVVTDLINRGMPLIRYNVEDIGIPTQRTCPCGRGLPLMEKVSGRVADFLMRKDGSLVAGVSLIERTLTAIKGIEQLQIIQEAVDEIILNIVRMEDYDASSEKELFHEFTTVFGKDIRIKANYVNRIPQEQSGKYRFAICKVLSSGQLPGPLTPHVQPSC